MPELEHLKLSHKVELERILTLKEAAELSGISVRSLYRHYPHMFCRMSPWRVGIRLKDALKIGKPAAG